MTPTVEEIVSDADEGETNRLGTTFPTGGFAIVAVISVYLVGG